MQLVEVTTKEHIKQFHALPFEIYKNDAAWIPALRQDIEQIFDPKKNEFYTHGEAIRWILLNSKGTCIGRIAAFINEKKASTFQQPTGGMGFFECINDQETAFFLFDSAKDWLAARGMEAMDGPINFGENDKFWGLIIENFEDPPYYGQNYNPEYYKTLFEAYGFEIYYKQLVFYRDYHMPLQEVFERRAKRFEDKPQYRVEKFRKKDHFKFAEDFRTIYNRAWQTHENFKGMSQEQSIAILGKMMPVIDENLIYFAYNEQVPIGFFIGLPELNQAFKYANGNLNTWGKLKVFWYTKIKNVVNTSFGLAFGIDPKYQGLGVEGFIFRVYKNEVAKQPEKYKDLIITWIGDFNPKMVNIIEGLGAKVFRRMATYRYLFDRSKPFERSPIITGRKENVKS